MGRAGGLAELADQRWSAWLPAKRGWTLAAAGREFRCRWLLLLAQPVGEDDLDDRLDCFLAGPVALHLARERDPADGLRAGLDHAVQAGPVGLGRGAGDRVNDGVDLVPFAQRIQGGEGHTA